MIYLSPPDVGDLEESYLVTAVRSGWPAASFGKAAVVSFNGNEVMTTSGRGALLTDDEEFATHVRYLATLACQPVAHYEHTDIGYNYRTPNLLAALRRSQLTRLELMVERCCAIGC